MDEKRRRRLTGIWVLFALLMGYVTLSDGFEVGLGDLLGLLTAVFGLALAYVYYANPNGVLDFGE